VAKVQIVEVDNHPSFSATASAVELGYDKSLIALYNGNNAGKILRIREIYVVNSCCNDAVYGVVAAIELRRIAGLSSGTPIVPQSNDTADNLANNIVAATGGTVSGESSAFIRRWNMSTDEWTPGILTVEAVQATLQTYSPIFSRRDIEMRPLTLRNGQGLTVKCVTNTTAGVFDVVVCFTQEKEAEE
jgi:hypothetical protein